MALSAPRRDGPVAFALRGPVPVALGGVLLGLVGGLAVARLGPLFPLLLLIGGVGAALVLTEPRWGLLGILGIVTLLPFGTLPFKLGLTPTLLECALGLTWLVFALRLFLRREERLLPTALDGPLAFFLIITLFAFVLGLSGSYTTTTIHDYVKMLLAISLFFLITNLLRTPGDLRIALIALTALGAAAAALGLALWALGTRAEPLLARLAIVGYPTGKIIRHLEDNPAKAIRATGTGVDPNSFAGLLMVVLVLAIGQFAARRSLVPRTIAAPAIPVLGLCLLLTQSRASWVGAAAGVGLLAILRYRRLLPPIVLAVPLVLALGIGRSFVERFVLGIRLQDPATQLRLAEYRNALAIIREHPLFGVGFGAAPSIDLQAGVSSVYLTLAERVGLLGLALYVLLLVIIGLQLRPALFAGYARATAAGEAAVALAGALLAGIVAGTLDHYFFNITFPHMVALFWGLAGLALAAARLARAPGAADTPPAAPEGGTPA
jgi:O-antigen ligase